jgi:PTS system nitrogen regulatory IIA component
MDIGDFLSPSETTVGVRASTKDQLLKELCASAAATLKLDAESISSEILKREELGSTGIGGGVAVPHARIKGLDEPHGVLVRLRQPMDFDAIDGQPVDLVFLLLLPAAPVGEQLNALAAVARRLRDPHCVRELRRAPDSDTLFRAMNGQDVQ